MISYIDFIIDVLIWKYWVKQNTVLELTSPVLFYFFEPGY